MAVAHLGTNNTMALATNASSASGAMTVAAGTNVVGFADIAFDNTAGLSVSAVTQNAVAMAAVGAQSSNTTVSAFSQAWWVAAPATGTLAITMSATCADIFFNLSVFQGADQTTQPRAGTHQALSNPQTDASGNLSITVTSNVSDLTHTVLNGGSGGFSGSNQTLDGSNQLGTYAGGSDHATTAAGSVTHTWAGGAANNGKALVGFSIQAVGGTVTTSPLPQKPYALDIARNPIARAIKNLLAYSTVNPAAPAVSTILQRRTLHDFGTHAGGRTLRGDN